MCCSWCLAQFAGTQAFWGAASVFLENTFQEATSSRVWNAPTSTLLSKDTLVSRAAISNTKYGFLSADTQVQHSD